MTNAGAEIGVAPVGLEVAPAVDVDGDLVQNAAIRGASAVYVRRATSSGVEDFLELKESPPDAALEYLVTLGAGVVGVRVVDRTVEFVDSAGTPRLRMSPPEIVDVNGTAVQPEVLVSGCSYDSDPRAPWGRAPTLPQSSTCRVRLDWSSATLSYPILVDPAWTATGAMVVPTRRNHGLSSLSDGRVLASAGQSGGNSSSYLSSCELYDPSTNTWAATGSSGRVREHTVTTLANGKVLLAGGVTPLSGGSGTTATVIYSPTTGTWSPGPALATARWDHTATLLANGKVLVAGGYNGLNALASAELYDPSTNAWSSAGVLGQGREAHGARLLPSGKVLVVGGWTNNTYLSSAELYDPATNVFSTTGSLSMGRAGAAVAMMPSGLLLVGGGSNTAGALTSAEIYNPMTGLFTATPPSSTASYGSASPVVLTDESVLHIGSSSVETYDSWNNSWSSETALPVALTGFRALKLKSGPVLCAGGDVSGNPGAYVFGGTNTDGEEPTGTVLGADWLTTTGTLASSDLISVRVINPSGATGTYDLKLVAHGLDGRTASRVVASGLAMSSSAQTQTFQVAQLPIRSVGTPAFVEVHLLTGSAEFVSRPLHYAFTSTAYTSAQLFGIDRKPIPGTDPASVFGVTGGELTINTSTLDNQVASATAGLATVTGQVWQDASGFIDVATLSPQGGTGGTVKGSYPLDYTFSGLASREFSYAPIVGEFGQTFTVCASWMTTFVDSGYGEPVLNSRSQTATQAAYAQYLIKKGATNVAKGQLDPSGCATVTLALGTNYVFHLFPVFDAAGSKFEVRYRSTRSTPDKVYVARWSGTGVPLSPPQTATVTDESLDLATSFVTSTAGAGTINMLSGFEDSATRVAAVISRMLLASDSGILAKEYRAFSDEVCDNGTACTDPSPFRPWVHFGPFVMTDAYGADIQTHNTKWKFPIAHEFGHAIQFRTGGVVSGSYGTYPTDPNYCNCNLVRETDRAHCLNSKGPDPIGQVEGFAHFYASKLWNGWVNTTSPPIPCTFVYYKESFGPSNYLALKPDIPPTARTCDTPVKWLDNYCGGTSGVSIEWDWLNFLAAVNRGSADYYSVIDLGNVYEMACSGRTGPDAQCLFLDPPTLSDLSAAAEALFGTGSTKTSKFSNDAFANGVH